MPPPPSPLTVLIVDDHFVVRSGLAASLELDDSIKVVGEAERGEEVVAIYHRTRPKVVLNAPPPGYEPALALALSADGKLLASGRGDELASEEMVVAIRELLVPQTTIITPNSLEARRLAAEIAPVVAELDAETRDYVRIVDGETVDPFPGRPDSSISTVERLRGLARYVAGRIRPAVAAAVPTGERLQVVIEFQMGANARARAVAAALVALFAEQDVIIVGPTLKNKVAACEEGRYYHFAARYTTTYAANKAHAKFNFAQFEKLFGTGIPATSPALRGHIADSFMQVVGHLALGGSDAEALDRF